MSHFDDSPHEMHDDSLTPEVAERLFDGEIHSPEFADLAAMVDDVRHAASATATPEVRGALAEFVGLTTPAQLPQPRRRSVIAEVVTFAGTVSGKLLIGGSLAAASVTGAQATGLVDLPIVDKPASVVVADETPDQLPLEDFLQAEIDSLEADTSAEDAESEAAEPAEAKPAENPEAYPVERAPEPKVEEPVEEEADAAEEKPAEEKPVEAEKPAEEEKPAADEAKGDKNDEKKDDKPDNEAAIAALQAQLAIDKEAVYAAASALMQPIETEKKALIAALNEVLAPLEQARNDAKAPLYAELETTTDPDRKIEIEAELSAIYNQWVIDRDAAAAAANPAIAELETQLTNIEIDRDAEISALLAQFQLDIDALG